DPRRAVFPGSFDPLTVSHLDIIRTCAAMFTSLHVVVARNPAKDKAALFTPQERAELIRRCLPPAHTVEVWDGLTVHYAQRVQAGRIVRGLGRAEDYMVEVRLWKTNALLAPEIQTVWVPPRAEHLDVSSSMIKEAALFGGWDGVKHLVPECIREDVGRRIEERRGELPAE
ncbi:MAG TPA: pantetheine-phosphate adenylyltransferase, partial [Armatimonadota bacterium]|nr:pantetheine-phosphate adenylyltransferase [Armatimonadota bacterium]